MPVIDEQIRLTDQSGDTSEPRVCHTMDAATLQPLCGAERRSPQKPLHSRETCEREGHVKCPICDLVLGLR